MEESSRVANIERNIFRIGLLLLIGEAVFLLSVLLIRPATFVKMAGLISAILVGGHLVSIPTGLSMGFRTGELICFLSFFNLMWLLLWYTLVVKLSERMVSRRFIGRMVLDTHKIAGRQRSKVGRFGILGLAIFVWLPFPWTGAVVGSIIGLLMGWTTERVMFVVVPSMLAAIITWTLAFKYLFHVMDQLEKWSSGVLAICIILLAILLRFRRAHAQPGQPG